MKKTIEERLTFAKAAGWIEARYGFRPSPSTVWRWGREGIALPNGDRSYLRMERVGRRLFTTTKALEKFVSETAEIEQAVAARGRGDDGGDSPTTNRAESVSRARRALDQANI